MGKNEDDILLEAEDKVATLKTQIEGWEKPVDITESWRRRRYYSGRADGLKACSPTIEKLTEDIKVKEVEIKKLLGETRVVRELLKEID